MASFLDIAQNNSIVYQMDCNIGMKSIPDKYFDIAICDIPYGINVAKMSYLTEVKNTTKQKNGSRLNSNRNKTPYTLKEWDNKPPEQSYYDELKRISSNQIIFGIEYVNWSGVGAGRIIWNKHDSDGLSFKKQEVAYCSLIDETVELNLLWSGFRQAKSLAEPMTQKGNKKLNEKRIHPCHKPILLYDMLIKEYGFKGCKIIDTHVGGGSSRISAHKAGCKYVGFEIDEEYFLKQEQRFNQYIKQLSLFNPHES